MVNKTNLAYDRKQAEPQKENQTKIKVVKKSGQVRRTRFLAAKTVLCVAIFFAGIIGIIMSQVAITEVTMNVTSSSQELAELESNYRALKAEVESSAALGNVEAIATREKGMLKLRDDQVIYVDLSEGDSVDIAENNSSSFLQKLKETFFSVMEYLGPEENTME